MHRQQTIELVVRCSLTIQVDIFATVAELVDASDLKSDVRKGVPVRFRSVVPYKNTLTCDREI